jgi:hypothetical protein
MKKKAAATSEMMDGLLVTTAWGKVFIYSCKCYYDDDYQPALSHAAEVIAMMLHSK